jgi:predicted MFS family arabinose efflux permease
MSGRQIGIVVVLVGVVAALSAALADPLGIGGSDDFGWKQEVLLAVGILLIIAGGVVALYPRNGTRAAPPQ